MVKALPHILCLHYNFRQCQQCFCWSSSSVTPFHLPVMRMSMQTRVWTVGNHIAWAKVCLGQKYIWQLGVGQGKEVHQLTP